jgi:Zn-dependent peptidase ImmA (M78 family)/DNA-binding XRE family transcriptional regulator
VNISQEDLARRLREARERAGLTQDEVARRLKIPRSAVALLEAGKRKVSGVELASLAYLYGRSAADFFAPDFAADGVSVLLRALPETTNHDETQEAIRKGIALAWEIANLEELLGVERATAAFPQYATALLRRRWEAVEQGKRLAHQERKRLELGSAPLEDLGDLMENQGIVVLEVELPDYLSGFTVRLNGSIVCGTSISHPPERRRFSLAHEYCHVLIDHDRSGIVSRQEEEDELREVRANAFAAGFLMPEDGIRDYLFRLNKGLPSRPREAVLPASGDVLFAEGRLPPDASEMGVWHVCLLAGYFRVSRRAMIWRLFNLRLITERMRDELLVAEDDGSGRRMARLLGIETALREDNETSTQKEQRARSGQFRLSRRRLLHLALEALWREVISPRKFRELVRLGGFDEAEVESLLEKTRPAWDRGL